MQVTRKGIVRGGLAIIGTILLGAIGSGVWETLLGPALRVIRNWVLDSIALVFVGFKNGVYFEIARDHSSGVNVQNYGLLSIIIFGALLFCLMYLDIELRHVEKEQRSLAQEVEEVLSGKKQEQKTAAQMETEIKRLGPEIRQTRKILYVLNAASALIIAIAIISYSRVSYVDSALTHYHHVLRITRPFLNPNEQLVVESQFAQVKSRQAYIEVVNRLAAVAKANGQSVPDFEPW